MVMCPRKRTTGTATSTTAASFQGNTGGTCLRRPRGTISMRRSLCMMVILYHNVVTTASFLPMRSTTSPAIRVVDCTSPPSPSRPTTTHSQTNYYPRHHIRSEKRLQRLGVTLADDMDDGGIVQTLPGGSAAIFDAARQLANGTTSAGGATANNSGDFNNNNKNNILIIGSQAARFPRSKFTANTANTGTYTGGSTSARNSNGSSSSRNTPPRWHSLRETNRRGGSVGTGTTSSSTTNMASSSPPPTTIPAMAGTTTNQSATLGRGVPSSPNLGLVRGNDPRAMYARLLYRNARKQSPAMWRYTVRTFDRILRGPTATTATTGNVLSATATTLLSTSHSNKNGIKHFKPETIHYEAALLACAKLGAWEKAVEWYMQVWNQEQQQRQQQQQQPSQQLPSSELTSQTESSLGARQLIPEQRSRKLNGLGSSSSSSTSSTTSSLPISTRKSNLRLASSLQITETMLDSVVRACVRASRRKQRKQPSVYFAAPSSVVTATTITTGGGGKDGMDALAVTANQLSSPAGQTATTGKTSAGVPVTKFQSETDRSLLSDRGNSGVSSSRVSGTEPLDMAVQIVLNTTRTHPNVPLMARHLNPLAAAYQSMGAYEQAEVLLRSHLANRIVGPESENGPDPFNVYDVGAKNKASYTLLVQGAVSRGNWTQAVTALTDMTEAGLYPAQRHLNAWTEIAERKTKQRTTRSWKKKREEWWLDYVRNAPVPTTTRVQSHPL